jgi:hypothetical protein
LTSVAAEAGACALGSTPPGDDRSPPTVAVHRAEPNAVLGRDRAARTSLIDALPHIKCRRHSPPASRRAPPSDWLRAAPAPWRAPAPIGVSLRPTISHYRGVKLSRLSAPVGRFCLRRGADLPQVGPCACVLGASRGLGWRRRRPQVDVRTALLLNRGPGALVGSGAGGMARPLLRRPGFYRSLSKHSCRSIGLAIQRQRSRSLSRHLSPCRSSDPPP